MEWHGFKLEEFVFEGRLASIVFPEKPDENRNWAFKMEYRDAFPETEILLLEKGFHIVYLQNESRWGSDVDCALKARLIWHLKQKYRLNGKGALIGMSAGGACSINFCTLYPELVGCMFLDAPVVDFASCPSKTLSEAWDNEIEKVYPDITRENVKSFFGNPINRINKMANERIPIILLYGDKDDVVLYEENGALIENLYRDKRDIFKKIIRAGQGHHPHGLLTESAPIVDAIINFLNK